MNALELADWIENGAPFGKYETAKQAVVMLRQQQAEIEHLKELFGCDPAYFEPDTHPAELTDEEILKIADDPDLCNYDGSLRSCIDFARAILRKAQEK